MDGLTRAFHSNNTDGFHEMSGESLDLSEQGKVATHARKDVDTHGVAISARPLTKRAEGGAYFEVRPRNKGLVIRTPKSGG